jgi:3-hydroxyisobutyrate dehydrogenase-like beta-hydroxyacid dehydrogenase
MMHVGVVGLGKMGSAIARNLLARGYQVSVWNRSPEPADALAGAGAMRHSSLKELVEAVDTVIVMLWGDDAAREVTLGQVIPAARAPKLVIEMSTLSPAMYERLARLTGNRFRAQAPSPQPRPTARCGCFPTSQAAATSTSGTM